MGIKGLHKALSFCTVKDNLRNYRNAIVAVDTSSWMHRSVYSISEKFVETTDSGRLDEGCVLVSAGYIIARCKELIEAFGIRAVYLVMDGKRIPLKEDETQERDNKRQQNLTEARRFKNAGQIWKAEDKYKSCIRIRDGFTRAVIREVKKAFSTYGRVHFVNSPHEADSQLTRLVLDGVADAVITEDSDVLVYSAAAHKAFPILFKLDRKTGDCDSINMDWLLSVGFEESSKTLKSNNTLELIFRRLAARQAKRRGFGVRLFVQGCILAGCDYRKNIEGIGTTNAFKLVRDNAFRNDSVRFRKILDSLPKKTKEKIDIDNYEEILAKSEAIFFYHPVLHTDGNVKPLLTPRLSPDECGDEHHFTDHYPFMSRFQGDWSFLGTIRSGPDTSVADTSSTREEHQPLEVVEPTKDRVDSSSLPTKKRDLTRLSSSTRPKIIHNPYKKAKSHGAKESPLSSLEDRNINTYTNPGNNISSQMQPKAQTKKAGDITKFLSKPDPRYARRSFSSCTTMVKGSRASSLSGASSSFQLLSGSIVSKKSAGRSFFLTQADKETKSSHNRVSGIGHGRFVYDSKIHDTENTSASSYSQPKMFKSFSSRLETERKRSDTVVFSSNNPDPQDFYDLTTSNSSDSDELDDDGDDDDDDDGGGGGGNVNRTSESDTVAEKERRITLVPPEDTPTTEGQDCNDSRDTVDRSSSTNQSCESEQGDPTTSKYFLKKTNSRRVTLDAIDNFTSPEISSFVGEQSILPNPIDYDPATCPETRTYVVNKNNRETHEPIDDLEEILETENPKPASLANALLREGQKPG
eukprot:CAMPEP_0201135696 /NCGR_PEP_ID=MMETSP0850-20130426/54458_1 /ASSEMBLY_ACC=CAM_ASM_000622 /TAXON_ID=183588 /ORGANISM="Pseudo-nitzschia fraudulenta, Strain WWA7" /LENGTH=805 /DNA_ID=CAMNT_0047406891 /DNA_START=1253 /DNA_END=3672 /DNA_ORIENTATION=-